MQRTCAICGKKLADDMRSDAQYCSTNCRKKAARLTHLAQKQKRSRTLTADEHADCIAIYAHSRRAYTGLMKLLAVYGKDFMLDTLTVIEDLIGDMSPEKSADENVELSTGAEV